MAKLVTLADLLADIRAQYDVLSEEIDDTVLTRWVNRSLAYLWDIITSVAPDHFWSTDTIAVVSGTDEYNMQTEVADFYRGRGVDVLLESGVYSPLRTFAIEERHLYATGITSRGDQMYRYMGSKLILAPTPLWSGTIRVNYIPTATVLVGGGAPNSVDLFNSWEEFIIIDVALKCAIRQEAQTKDLRDRRAELKEDIKTFAPQRDLSHNDTVRDVTGSEVYDPFARLPWPE